MQLKKIVLVLLCGAALSACQSVSTTRGGAVGADRSQNMSMLVSSAELEAQANQSYQQLVRDAQARGLLNRDAAQTSRVRAIANRLIPQTKVFRDDLAGWKWEVNVLTKNELNAWCMPGGKIMFYSGIIEQLQLTDDEIAAIMGHEMAHALREHARERASDAATQNLLFSGVSILTGGKYDNTIGMAQEGTKYLWTLPNSREHEAEADRMGVELAARAGYNPQAAVNVWRKMQAKGGGGTPEFMSTHPSADTRIADLSAQIAKVQPLYTAALKDPKVMKANAQKATASTAPAPSTALPFVGTRTFNLVGEGRVNERAITINKDGSTTVRTIGNMRNETLYSGKFTNPIIISKKAGKSSAGYNERLLIKGDVIQLVDANNNIIRNVDECYNNAQGSTEYENATKSGYCLSKLYK